MWTEVPGSRLGGGQEGRVDSAPFLSNFHQVVALALQKWLGANRLR